MAVVAVHEVTWILTAEAQADLASIRAQHGNGYFADVVLLKTYLCDYFSGEKACASKCGKSISPIGSACNTGKLLKVRWLIPGCGKSGGLRLAIVAFCNERKVVVCRGWVRKEDPDDDAFAEGGKLAGSYLTDSIDK